MNTRNWPANFPDGCPPTECNSEKITVFRMVEMDKPDSNDFRMTCEDHPEYCSRYKREDGLIYYRLYAVSMFKDLDKIKNDIHLAGNLKRTFRKAPYVAKGDTRDGVHLETSSPVTLHHIAVWLYADSTPEEYFEVVEKIDI